MIPPVGLPHQKWCLSMEKHFISLFCVMFFLLTMDMVVYVFIYRSSNKKKFKPSGSVKKSVFNLVYFVSVFTTVIV